MYGLLEFCPVLNTHKAWILSQNSEKAHDIRTIVFAVYIVRPTLHLWIVVRGPLRMRREPCYQ